MELTQNLNFYAHTKIASNMLKTKSLRNAEKDWQVCITVADFSSLLLYNKTQIVEDSKTFE